MPTGVGEQLRLTGEGNDADAAGNLWSREAEASLIRAYQAAGSPPFAGPNSIGLGMPILRFRWRMKSVGDVLKGMKNHVFTEDRWTAL